MAIATIAALVAAAPAGAVVGGEPVAEATVPWFATINGCGGVLVAPDRVATAGHCVRNRSPHRPHTFESAGGAPPPSGATGLYHVALVYPDRRELGRAVRRLLDHGFAIDHATDHGATVSVYLADPDANGVELYYDRPRADWFDDDGRPVLKNERFDHRTLVD